MFKSENCSQGFIKTVHWQLCKMQLCQRPLAPAYSSGIQFSNTPNYISWSRKTRSIDNCTKDEVRGDFITAATQALN